MNIYPVIESRNPDLKAFFQLMKNQLNAVDCAKFINDKGPATWDMIDPVDYLNDHELLILVQIINIQNQELYKERINLSFLSSNRPVKKIRFHLACSKHELWGRCCNDDLEDHYKIYTQWRNSIFKRSLR